MSRRPLLTLLVLALVAASIAALGWYVLSDADTAPPQAVAPGMKVEPAAPASVDETIETASTDDRPEAVEEKVETRDEARTGVATQGDDELAQGLWVKGFVRFPEGTPLGETVHVIADGKDFRYRENHRARVEPDGSFRVAFAKGTKTGALKIEAQHLYLEPPLKVKLPDTQARIELVPALGGRIAGKLVPPPGSSDAAQVLEGVEIALHGWMGVGLGDGTQVRRTFTIGPDLEYSLAGVPAGLDCTLLCDPKVWVSRNVNNVEVGAGATKTLDLEFELGARVAGRVLDAAGAPLEDVNVAADVEPENTNDWIWQQRTAKSMADGSFELRGIAPGKLTVVASKKSLRELRHEVGKISNGDSREGLELRLEGGHALAGRVQWADGRPAAGAIVRIVDLDPSRESFSFSFDGGQSMKTGADGTFGFLGLGEGPFEVTASAASEVEVDPSLTGLAAKRARKGPIWRMRLASAPPDVDVVLTLKPGSGVNGIVVDDLGQPIRRYTLLAAKDGRDQEFFIGGATQKVDSKDGTFEFEGLHEGSWSVIARAKGHHPNTPVAVRVPGEGTALRLVLQRTATLSGVVLDPDGEPAPKVSVSVAKQDGDGPRGISIASEMMGGGSTDRTDAQGRFEISGAPIGNVQVTASSTTSASSEPLVLDLVPGQELSDLTLRLRRGGRITGELHASAGALAGREIMLDSSGQGWGGTDTTTDANGRFEFAHVTPGVYQVIAEPDEAELESLSGGDMQHDWELRMSLRKSASVTIAEGGTEHVVLGSPPRNPIRVSGVVRRGTRAVEGARLRFHAMELSSQNEAEGEDEVEIVPHMPKIAVADAQGRYEITLETPGKYSCSVQGPDSGTMTSRQIEVEAGSSQTVDFDLPSGRIAGRVLDPEGEPLQGVQLSLTRERTEAERDARGTHGGTNSDEDGAFAFDDLAPGTYSVLAQPYSFGWGRTNQQQEYASARRDGLVLAESASLTNVELRLTKAGSIEGIVRLSSGEPAVGALVIARDESGQMSQGYMSWNQRADESGHYTISNLAPGTWTLSAKTERESLLDGATTRVSASSRATLDLTLRPGTLLEVSIEESDGKKVGASLSLVDARGRDLSDVLSRPGSELGPVPPGRYTLRATNHSGASAETEVDLNGEERREVTLRFSSGE